MSSSRWVRAIFTVLLAAGLLEAREPWKEKPWTDWDEKDIAKVLENSPWVRWPQTSTPSGKRSPEGVRWLATGALAVRWESSLTIRQAKARKALLDGRATQEQIDDYMASAPSDFVVAVLGPAANGLLNLPREALRSAAYLQLQKGNKRWSSQEVKVLQQASGEPIVEFHFPREVDRTPLLDQSETKIGFIIKSPPLEAQADFDLRKMVRDGKPDL
jgi:hypothetical protein